MPLESVSPPSRGGFGSTVRHRPTDGWDPVAPLLGGRETVARRLAGVGPRGPPLTSGFVLVSFTGKFTDILGLVCLVIDHFISHVLPCNNPTRLPIFLGDSSFRGITRFR